MLLFNVYSLLHRCVQFFLYRNKVYLAQIGLYTHAYLAAVTYGKGHCGGVSFGAYACASGRSVERFLCSAYSL